MASDDHNERFDEVEASKRFVDPAGVAHTSELADLSDVGQTGVVLENTDGTTFMSTRTLQAGTGCEWVDDGNGTATLDVTVSGDGTDTNTHVAVENTDGTTLVGDVAAIQAGESVAFSDDGDGSVTLDYTGSGGSGSAATAPATATASGDDSTTTFGLPNPLSVAPSAVDVTAASEDACADFFISDKTTETIRITYPRAPPAGTDNLEWDILAHE